MVFNCKRYSLIFAVVLLAAAAAVFSEYSLASERVELSSYPVKKTVTRGETFEFRVEIAIKGESSDIEITSVSQPELKKLKLVKVSTANRSSVNDEGEATLLHVYTYFLEARETGPAKIGNIECKYRETSSGKTMTLDSPDWEITVIEPEINRAPVLVLITIFLIIPIPLVAFFVIRKRRRRLQLQREQESELEKAREIFKQKLDRLKMIKISGEGKKFYSELYEIIRELLKDRFNIIVEGHNFSTVLDEAKEAGNISGDEAALLKDLLEKCQHVKYSGAVPEISEMEKITGKLKELYT